jgi:deoxyribodipyrimidine photolyase
VSIEEARIRTLCDEPPDDAGSYVLYWMQHSQRAAHKPALEHAVRLANERERGVVVGFGSTPQRTTTPGTPR